jgi:SAM-dependent methyltransferase
MSAPDSQNLSMTRAARRKVLKGIYGVRVKTWDFVHGVDTCGSIPLTSFEFNSQNKTPGLEYQSHHPRIIRNALLATGIDFRKYTFVDYGCGKGRVLLVASQFPFKRIVGLEFVPQLAEIARRNVDRYRGLNRQCRDIQVITGDAAEFDLPQEPALLYFFSPFSTPVMNRVFNKIESSLEQEPRELVVLFTGVLGMRDKAFGRPPYQRVLRHPYYDVYLRQAARVAA